jgi:Fic family protein
MEAVSALLASGFQALDAKHSDRKLSDEEKLYATVSFACAAFVQLLTIHPYADGNGHAARFVAWAILGHYDYWPREWTIEPRPTHATYADEIVAHRNGNPTPLIRHMLQDLVR